MPRSARMLSHASAGGTAARAGHRSRNDAAWPSSLPAAGDAGSRLIPSNIYEQGALNAADFAQREREPSYARNWVTTV